MDTITQRRRARVLPRVSRAIGLTLAICSAAAQAAPSSPFVAALVGVWDQVGNPIVPELAASSATGPVEMTAGGLPAAQGTFRSDFGSTGFSIQVTGGIDREVYGGSVWSDGVVVSGGSGSGMLDLSSHITGTISGEGELGFALFVSDRPFDLQTLTDTVGAADGFWSVQLPDATRVMFTGIASPCGVPRSSGDCGHVPFENLVGPVDLTLTAQVPFVYGQTLYLISGLSGDVRAGGGSADFLHSAHVGISAPAGATLTALSGSVYVPAAVPEPATWLLMLAGCVLAGGWTQARRR